MANIGASGSGGASSAYLPELEAQKKAQAAATAATTTAAPASSAVTNTGRDYGASSSYTTQGTYYDQKMSAADTAIANEYSSQWQKATAAGDTALAEYYHQLAEQLRSTYGYSGGADGSTYIDVQSGPNKGDAYNPAQLPSATSQEAYINELYKAQQAAALQALKSAYDQNIIDTDALAAKIPETYQAARNQTQAGAEQQRYNWNQYASANGLNVGTGAQGTLSMSNQNMANMSNINAQEANAINDLDTQRLKIQTQYQNDIAQAIANGDMAKAQALYQEAVRVDESLVAVAQAQADENYRAWAASTSVTQDYNAQMQQYAETLAAYGDFSGYKATGQYTDDQIANMQAYWQLLNGGKTSGSNGGSGGSYTGSSGDITPTENSSFYNATGSNRFDNAGNLFSSGEYNSFTQDVGMMRGDAGRSAIIEDAYKEGKITESQATALLRQYGLA